MFVLLGAFAGLQGLVTLRSGHVRTFATRAAAAAVQTAMQQRSRGTRYTVLDQRAAETMFPEEWHSGTYRIAPGAAAG